MLCCYYCCLKTRMLCGVRLSFGVLGVAGGPWNGKTKVLYNGTEIL
jgi:hypothetical protein